MKRTNLVVSNSIICVLLVIELVLLVCGHGIAAGILAGIAAATALMLYILDRERDCAVAAVSCFGYAVAVVGGLIINSLFHEKAVEFGLLIGGLTLVAQMSLSLTHE